MMLGIRAHDLGKHTPEAFAKAVSDSKLSSIQLVLPKAIDFQSEDALINDPRLKATLTKALSQNKVKVAMMGAYFNPIHSNSATREAGINNFRAHLAKAKDYGTDYVGTETGSYNDDQWTWHPNNQSEEAYLKVLQTFQGLLPTAVEAGTYLTIEPAYHHVISTPIRLKRLVDELDSPQVRVIFDLFNLLHDGNYLEQHRLIDEMVELFCDKIVIVHAKDFVVEGGKIRQVAPGQGLLDYPYLLKKLGELKATPQLILEGVVGEDIEFSRQFLSSLMEEIYENKPNGNADGGNLRAGGF